MFDFTTETKTEEKKNIDDTCYGGFGGRLSYEQCRHRSRSAILGRAAVMTAVCLMLGMVGIIMGAAVYDMVMEHPSLYYPKDSIPVRTSAADRGSVPESAAETAAGSYSSMSDGTAEMISAENVTAELARKYRIPMGVMLHIVRAGSAAAAAGIEAGDIIVAVNGIEAADLETLERLLAEAADEVKLTVFRNNRYLNMTMKNEK